MKSSRVSTALLIGLVLLWIGERIADPEGSGRALCSGLGALLSAAAIAARVFLWRRATGQRQLVEGRLLLATAGVVLGELFYAASTARGLALLGVTDPAGSKVPAILGVGCAVVILCSLLPLLFMELSYASMPSDPSVERRRIDVSAHGGLTVALAIAALFFVGFGMNGWGKKWDLSYFKTTRPSAASLKLVARLGEPVKVWVWFPRVNEVRDQVMPYLRDVAAASRGKLRLEEVDQALRPKLAREQRVSKNGTIVLELEGKRETISMGLDLEDARSKLRRLDAEFQKAFLKVTRPGRVLYVTTGHEERGDPEARDDEAMGTDDWKTVLSELGVTTKNLGIGQGLASAVPDDATAVAVLGPRKAFLPEEARTLARYVEGGGHLFALVDPEDEHGLGSLLEALGLEAKPGLLVNAQTFIPRDRTPSDQAMVYSNRYSAHPTVTSASRLSTRTATIVVRGGALAKRDGARGNVTLAIRTDPRTWLDLDGDYTFDEGPERKESFAIAAAVAFPTGARGADASEGRAFVVADGDFVTDQVLRNLGNVTVVADALRWLVGEAELPGPPESEEDVKIEHTREEDKLWFWGTIAVVPGLVLLGGIGVVRRMRRGGKRP